MDPEDNNSNTGSQESSSPQISLASLSPLMDQEDNSSSTDSQESSSPIRNEIHQNDDLVEITDRLSELPESLIIQIISLLPTDEAVRTGVLSKRWKNLWNHVDRLCFLYNIEDRPERDLDNFIAFIDHTLLLCDSPRIKKFSLVAFLFDCASDDMILDRWLQWVYPRNVENLNVEVPGLSYTIPEWFYNSSSLVTLRLLDCNTNNLGDVSWTSLKSLKLSYVYVEDGHIAQLLAGCPVLQDLVLFELANSSRLKIMSRSLLKLSVVNFDEIGVDGLIEINAPCLKVLHLSGYFRGGVQLIDVSSLLHADLNIRLWPDPSMDPIRISNKILESVHHVEKLTFWPELIQALTILKLLNKPRPLLKCKQMTVCAPVTKYELPGIVYFLQSSPHLETLVIDVEAHKTNYLHQCIDIISHFEGTNFLDTQTADLSHLRNVKVSYYCKYTCSQIEQDASNTPFLECELIAFILRNPQVLEKMVIRSDQVICKCPRNCPGNCPQENVSVLSDKVLQVCMEHREIVEWRSRENKSHFEIIFW